MAATLHKLTAGDGYLYLIRQVAASDSTERGRNTLSEYYSAKGESPGRWVGTGLASLSRHRRPRRHPSSAVQEIWTVPEGSEVHEEQMAALFGEGLHPNAVDITNYNLAPRRATGVAIEDCPTGPPDSPCAPAKPSSNGHWRWPTASTTPARARSGIRPSTTTSGHRSEPPWRGSDSPTNTVASPPTTANCRALSPATPAPAPRRSPDTT